MTTSRRLGPALLADAWSLTLAAVVAHRLLFGRGYGLARDMVFTPAQPLSADAIGLGSAAPRAVPVDPLLGVLSLVLDGTWLGRIAVVGVLAVAGSGAHRFVTDRSAPARLATAGLAVWNPFVIERLALGQWSLLAAYAALPWLLRALLRYAFADGSVRPVVGWLALASITPTGGVLALTTAGVAGGGSGRLRTARLLGTAVALQLPWLLPSLLSTAGASSDPAGVAAFAARSERPGGALVSLFGLGGIWDAGSAPVSRSGALGYVTTVVVVAAVALGAPVLYRRWSRPGAVRLGVLAAGGLVLSAAAVLPGGAAVLRWAVGNVPGAGLLRDGQKWLLPFAVLAVQCVGALFDRLTDTVRAEAAGLIAVCAMALPVFLLPDAVATADRSLTPARYPPDFTVVAHLVDGRGAVVTLPFQSYRRFTWAPSSSVADPASRWFATPVLQSDELAVGSTVLIGEDLRAAHVAAALRAGVAPGRALADVGVAWALVYRDAPGVARLSTAGLHRVYSGRYLTLYRVEGVLRPFARPATATVALVTAADLAVLLAVVLTMIRPVARRSRHVVAT